MPVRWAVSWLNCFGVTVENCPSKAMSQPWPYRLGVPTRRSRFAPNVPAPATAATAIARPSMALRTGTLARPVPGSSANRMPVTAASGAPTNDSRSTSRGRRRNGSSTSAAGRAPACRHAVTATRASQQHHDGGEPGAEHRDVHADTRIGLGEPRGPDRGQRRGGDGDAPTASTAPAVTATRADLREAPGEQLAAGHAERRQGRVVACRPPVSSRTATWPTMSSAVSASARANSASATACGRIARSTVASCTDWSAMNTWPPVAG